MSSRNRKHDLKIKNFVAGLRQMLSALPSESEKKEIQAGYAALVEFLSDLQKRVNSLPSAESMDKIRETLQRLEDFLARAETNPALAATIGLRRPLSTRRSAAVLTEDEKTKAKTILASLESLPIDEIRKKLSNERACSMRELHAIASAVGIKSTKNLDRLALIHRITMKIENYRGYQSLSGMTAESKMTPKTEQGKNTDAQRRES